MNSIAVITGAGSGVGRATAVMLGERGWKVALVGRRAKALEEAAVFVGGADRVLVCPCDIGDPGAVEKMAASVLKRFGTVDVLINAAGTNVPDRSLERLSLEDYHRLVNTNLNGAYYCARCFLPAMRKQGAGTIVNIVSEAGRQASSKSGPAYVISKFGMAGLTQSINAEEREKGIRACSVFPGDIDTPLLELRPNPPEQEARERMLKGEDVAACVLLAIDLPQRAVVEEIVVKPRV